jgi:hypothetical protein
MSGLAAKLLYRNTMFLPAANQQKTGKTLPINPFSANMALHSS